MPKADPYQDRTTIEALLRRATSIRETIPGPCRLMEVCGTHTMAVHRSGLKSRLGEAGIELVAGPGCPVCITPNDVHEAALSLVSEREDLILAAFGDMTRVPTRRGSLQSAAPAQGSSVRVVYSPRESLDLARRHPDKEVVFFGAGFETTIPAIALTARRAAREKIANYTVLTALWIIPPPLRAILQAKDARISGFLYPGHVSAVIGPRAYDFVAEEFGLPGAIAGFEPADILLGVLSILEQMAEGKPRVGNAYARVVGPDGNPLARAVMAEILTEKDAVWRGLGLIPKSGLRLRSEYAAQDAEHRFGLALGGPAADLPGCRCGDVLKGIIEPPGCPLFGRACRPDLPHGPCMVSFEGACLAFYKYGRK
ncbi:MAG: hydrogenase formation protein HypD [Candidatus Aminicenantes bacterium]|nr:hydrogenase formation protein HypD [Candidatus Aminicenantes bacterium]